MAEPRTQAHTCTSESSVSAAVVGVDHLLQSLLEVVSLVENARYLAAGPLLQTTREAYAREQAQYSEDDRCRYESFLAENAVLLRCAEDRAKEIQETMDYEDTDTDWILGASYWGIDTFYKRSEVDHSIIAKMEGHIDNLPLFETCAVIHEVDLFTEWVPFCSESKCIHKEGKAELYPYVRINIPPVGRDCFLQAYGSDCLQEKSSIVIVGKSVPDADHEAYPVCLKKEGVQEVPWKPIGWFHNRAFVHEFKLIFHITSPTSVRVSQVVHVDPNTFIPQAMVNYLIKNLAGMLLFLYQKQVIKIASGENHETCSHAQRIRADTHFYRDWVLPRLREFCAKKGWEQPTIACLGEDGIPPSSGNEATFDTAATTGAINTTAATNATTTSATIATTSAANAEDGSKDAVVDSTVIENTLAATSTPTPTSKDVEAGVDLPLDPMNNGNRSRGDKNHSSSSIGSTSNCGGTAAAVGVS